MNESHARRVVVRSAVLVLVVNVVYLATGIAGLLSGHGALRGAGMRDPYLAVLEALIVVAAPLMALMMAGLHAVTPPRAKAYSLAAFGFMLVMAGVTSCIHFVQLAVVRRLDPAAQAALAPVVALPWRWPSIPFALDLLVWDVFFGLSMVFGALALGGWQPAAGARRAMWVSGTLCLVGSLGPVLGDLRLQIPAILGYAWVFPVVCLFLARTFRRDLGA